MQTDVLRRIRQNLGIGQGQQDLVGPQLGDVTVRAADGREHLLTHADGGGADWVDSPDSSRGVEGELKEGRGSNVADGQLVLDAVLVEVRGAGALESEPRTSTAPRPACRDDD